jgi:outer membrane lipoprotein carrier protein
MSVTIRFNSVFGAAALAAGLSLMSAHATPIEELQQFNREVKSASGTFTQQVLGGKSKTSSGTFVFARPGKFRWTYTKPYEQVLVSDGKTLTIYDKDLNQVTKKSLGSAIGSSPAAVLFGGADLSANFTLSDAGEKEGRSWIQAIPKSKSSSFKKVNIGMSNGLPSAMELYDNLGKVTVLVFSGMQRNPSVSAGSFTFTPPAGAATAK